MERTEPLLSVVIPVYRVEQTLDRCLESVLSSPRRDMEVVLVDDGSPDGCPAMCDAWASRDSRVRALHKPNGGLSSARNAGVAASRGRLLMFVDSDDALAPGTLDAVVGAMLSAPPDCDIVEFPVRRVGGRRDGETVSLEPRLWDDMRVYWLASGAYDHAFAWNKVYRRRVFDGVGYPEGRVFEDILTLPLLLLRTRRLLTVACGCYLYRDNASGITARAEGSADSLRTLLEAHIGAWRVLGLGIADNCGNADNGKNEVDNCGNVDNCGETCCHALPQRRLRLLRDLCYMHALDRQITLHAAAPSLPLMLPFRRVSLWSIMVMRPRRALKALLLRLGGVGVVCRLFARLRPLR